MSTSFPRVWFWYFAYYRFCYSLLQSSDSPRRHSSPYVRVPLRIGLILPGVFLLIYPPFQVSKKIGFLCYINTLEPKQERTRCEPQTR
ncbi:hypothetical protein AtEden1_Chr1g0078981 [Arabidopsis thaliana]